MRADVVIYSQMFSNESYLLSNLAIFKAGIPTEWRQTSEAITTLYTSAVRSSVQDEY